MTREEILSISKPILFNTEMVRAILDGRKTVTRRVRKIPPYHFEDCHNREKIVEYSDGAWYCGACGGDGMGYQYGHPPKSLFPKYKRGEYLYVRETWAYNIHKDCEYRADFSDEENSYRKSRYGIVLSRWKPSIHMPKEAARIFLRVTDVRVERLQDITEEQAVKEGCGIRLPSGGWDKNPLNKFCDIWNSTIKPAALPLYGWNANPWVWVYEFEVVVPS